MSQCLELRKNLKNWRLLGKKTICVPLLLAVSNFLKIVKVKIWGYGSLVPDIDKSLGKTLKISGKSV